jgi:ketosteroid isomerase-like protein
VHPNAALLQRFYEAFDRRDAAAMGACYTDDVRFEDPAFGLLVGEQARGMWRMLCERGKDLRVVASGIEADDMCGSAHWDATYTFSQTGRKVLNRIDAQFEFRDGLICAHRDRFDFWRWSRQALGAPGLLLGWTPLLQNKVRAQARANLDRYLAN